MGVYHRTRPVPPDPNEDIPDYAGPRYTIRYTSGTGRILWAKMNDNAIASGSTTAVFTIC